MVKSIETQIREAVESASELSVDGKNAQYLRTETVDVIMIKLMPVVKSIVSDLRRKKG